MNIKILFLGALFYLFGTFSCLAGIIEDVRLSNYRPQTVRLVLDMTEKADVSVFRLSNPPRLVIDLENADFKSGVRQKKIKKTGFISAVRFGFPDKKTARIVLDLPQFSLEEKHFLLPPQAGNKDWRFVMDLSSDLSRTKATKVMEAPATVKKSPSITPFSKKTKKVIVLDAGHGGQDPGAISRYGNYEKDLTLKMARETRDLLEKEGYKVVMTRDKDVFISLRGRIKKAHEANADLFISIHADSAKNSSARGLSVYTISETASDKEAAALAERENKADILIGMDLVEYQPEVGNILIDLAKRETMDKSAKYAVHLVGEMKKTVKLLPNAHRFAGFVVLKSPNIPSVLVELGYLSNKTEDRQLQKKSYRRDLAKSLTRAVNKYFEEMEK